MHASPCIIEWTYMKIIYSTISIHFPIYSCSLLLPFLYTLTKKREWIRGVDRLLRIILKNCMMFKQNKNGEKNELLLSYIFKLLVWICDKKKGTLHTNFHFHCSSSKYFLYPSGWRLWKTNIPATSLELWHKFKEMPPFLMK